MGGNSELNTDASVVPLEALALLKRTEFQALLKHSYRTCAWPLSRARLTGMRLEQ